MPSHFTASSRYLYLSACWSRMVRYQIHIILRADCQDSIRPLRVSVLSSNSTYTTLWVGSMRTKTKSVAVRLRSIMAVLPCLASSVFLPSPKHLVPSHHSRGSSLSTLVITWCHSKVTSASFSYPQKSHRVHGQKQFVMRAGKTWLLLRKPILIFLGRWLVSGIH